MVDQVAEALRSCCILGTIRCTALGLQRTDRETSREVNAEQGAVSNAGRVIVSRLAGVEQYHKAILLAQKDCRDMLASMSMPYGEDTGWRIVPNEHFEPLMGKLRKHKTVFDDAVQHLIDNADSIIAMARQNVGQYNVQPPSKEELVGAYTMKTEFREFPDGDFKHMPVQARATLQKHSEKRLIEAYETAKGDTFGRVYSSLEQFVERMEAYDQRLRKQAAGEDVGRNGVFRDSVVEHVAELQRMLSSFNVAGDERMAHLEQRLAVLLAKPDDLRKNDVQRAASKRVGYELLDMLKDWMPRKDLAA